MTGYGEAHHEQDGMFVAVEMRSINSRHFKLSTRLGEGYAILEPKVDQAVRQTVRRGTVQVTMRITHQHRPEDYRLNTEVLAAYQDQLSQLCGDQRAPIESLLQLPGVVDERGARATDAEAHWPVIKRALSLAMEKLSEMRRDEGRAMADDLSANCQAIAGELREIEAIAPTVAEGYRDRLRDRLDKMLKQQGLTIEPADILREVSIFAERSDISEEVVRLRSHLDQFAATLEMEESSGRKLEFVTQEMFRETNTIGSKANHVEISRHVIEIKANVERIREMIQNVE